MPLKPGELDLGTTIIAAEFKDGVVMGADTRATMGSYISTRNANKITQLHEKIHLCRSGSSSDTQAISDIVKYYLQLYSIVNEEPTTLTAAELMRELNYNNKEVLSAAFIVAGWDKHSGGNVYILPLGGTLHKAPFAITGSGSTYIYGYCDSLYRKNMEKEEALNFLKNALALAMSRDGSSGGSIRMAVITEEGVERLYIHNKDIPEYNDLEN
ncbi:hypothetical protein Glove_465g65 [Diversispora epigaea]|uniref:proteasome endopeptidase complex n=1 Tax=Diversispora epigaea TaxID=1348612 RepID=A0A397GVL0_9GLOM|nr:hypothetical protein Glove_465g65 [Diversispora epigaea]